MCILLPIYFLVAVPGPQTHTKLQSISPFLPLYLQFGKSIGSISTHRFVLKKIKKIKKLSKNKLKINKLTKINVPPLKYLT
jgi:hypothetical protein